MRAPQVGITRGTPGTSLPARLGRRGWAVARTGVLVGLTGLLIACVLATMFGALLIAINGRLP